MKYSLSFYEKTLTELRGFTEEREGEGKVGIAFVSTTGSNLVPATLSD
jgi:hypothetical protein